MDKYSTYKEFRIMYVAQGAFLEILKKEFLLAGARIKDQNNQNSLCLTAQFLRQMAYMPNGFPGININFYSDVHELARELPSFNPDLIFVDERKSDFLGSQELPRGDILPQQEYLISSTYVRDVDALKQEINFENLLEAVERFTPKAFNYTTRRILVILPKSSESDQREFFLSLQNVRGVFQEPPHISDLLLQATRQLFDFRNKHQKTSLCVSGGGLEGYIYSLGVVNALDRCFEKKQMVEFDIFCGVSSGAILTSVLAAGMSSEDLVKQMYGKHPSLDPISLKTVFDLAAGEIFRRILGFARAFTTLDIAESLSLLQKAVPVGFFKGERLTRFLERQIRHFGARDNIASLSKELYIGVTEQDTGEALVLGEEPWRDIKISQAVRASTALPPFYLPEKINGHWFTDGQLTNGADFNLAIRKGSGLVVHVDPMVGFSSNLPGAVVGRGGYFSLIQAIKSLVQSRSRSLWKHAMDTHPDVDFILFSPTDDVMEAMAGNPMKYHIRTDLVELGYQCTIKKILDFYEAHAHKFAKHGFVLKSKEEIAGLI